MGKFTHAEAYRLMSYVSDDGTTGELVWNSRDGVTPFIITSRDGQHQLTHTDWSHDIFARNFRPPPGFRLFVDMTQEMALEAARERVEEWWDHPEYPMKSRWPSKDAAAQALAAEYFGDGANPTLIEAPARPPVKKGPFG